MAKLYKDDTENRYIHIYYNVAKQAAERIHFEQTLDKMKLKLEKGLRQPCTWTKLYHDLFELKYDKSVTVGAACRGDSVPLNWHW